MKRLIMAAAVLAVAVGLLGGLGPAVRAQPVASIALPSPRGVVQLYSGCNNIALSFPDGTAGQTVVQGVTPPGMVESVWRHNAAQGRFEGFNPAFPSVSDLQTVNLWDAVWLCIAAGVTPSPPSPPPSPPPAAPTATPVPTPSQAAGFAVRKTSDYVSGIGTLHVVGEVANNNAFDAEYVKIVGTFLDDAGNVLATDFAYSCLDIVPGHSDSPFHLGVWDPPPGIVRYTLQVEGEGAREAPPLGLEISGVTSNVSEIGTFHVLGLVTNNSDLTYEYVKICGALYDDTGNVIRADFTYTQVDTLAPGQSSSFDYAEWDAPPVASYRLWVQARPM